MESLCGNSDGSSAWVLPVTWERPLSLACLSPGCLEVWGHKAVNWSPFYIHLLFCLYLSNSKINLNLLNIYTYMIIKSNSERERQRDCPPSGSLHKRRKSGAPFWSLMWVSETQVLGPFCCLFRLISTELDETWGSQDSNRLPNMRCWCHKQ